MREIKFRAWDKEKKQMIYPDTKSEEWDYFELTLKGEICLYDSDDGRKNGFWEHTVTYNEGRFVLMQSIGLKDKKRTEEYPEGQEIYEGDIVTHGDNYYSVIEWQCNPDQDEFVGFYQHEIYPKGEPDRFHSMFAYTTPFEVIGNIHQNPELTEAQSGN